jgi:CelD/BcsL family acetyltransferase involved in cellulose biosynthesis
MGTVMASAAHDTAELTHVEIVEQTAGFEALRPRWNDLLRASSANNPFLTWEWLYAWWISLGEGSRLRLFVVYVGAEVVAIAPLRAVRSRSPWFSSLEFLGTGFAGSDYLDLIVRGGFEAPAIEALAQSIASQGLALRLSHLPARSLAARLAAQLEGGGWARRESSVGWCPLIPLAGHSWESYLATRGPAHRANIRRRIRSLLRTFTVQFERVTTEPRRLEALEALTRFHERRFDGPRGAHSP